MRIAKLILVCGDLLYVSTFDVNEIRWSALIDGTRNVGCGCLKMLFLEEKGRVTCGDCITVKEYFQSFEQLFSYQCPCVNLGYNIFVSIRLRTTDSGL